MERGDCGRGFWGIVEPSLSGEDLLWDSVEEEGDG